MTIINDVVKNHKYQHEQFDQTFRDSAIGAIDNSTSSFTRTLTRQTAASINAQNADLSESERAR